MGDEGRATGGIREGPSSQSFTCRRLFSPPTLPPPSLKVRRCRCTPAAVGGYWLLPRRPRRALVLVIVGLVSTDHPDGPSGAISGSSGE